MTRGEQLAAFFLLLSERSTVRQLMEGTHNAGGVAPGAGAAATQAALVQRAQAVLTGLGIAAGNLPSARNLGLLWDPVNGRYNVTTAAITISAAMEVDPYGGTCPGSAEGGQVLAGLKYTLG